MEKKITRKIAKIKTAIEKDLKNNSNVEKLAKKNNIQITKLQNYFKYKYGYSPKEYMNKVRLDKLPNLVSQYKDKTSENTFNISKELGFTTKTGLSHFVKRKTGKTYREYYNHIIDQEANPDDFNFRESR